MSTQTVSIDRTGLTPSTALVFSGAEDGTLWGLATFTPPPKAGQVAYAADSNWVHGSLATSAKWQQSLLTFDTQPRATSEAALQSALAELDAALGRLAYAVTTTSNGQSQTWAADWGTWVFANGRQLEDLGTFSPVITVTIPVYPVAS